MPNLPRLHYVKCTARRRRQRWQPCHTHDWHLRCWHSLAPLAVHVWGYPSKCFFFPRVHRVYWDKQRKLLSPHFVNHLAVSSSSYAEAIWHKHSMSMYGHPAPSTFYEEYIIVSLYNKGGLCNTSTVLMLSSQSYPIDLQISGPIIHFVANPLMVTIWLKLETGSRNPFVLTVTFVQPTESSPVSHMNLFGEERLAPDGS